MHARYRVFAIDAREQVGQGGLVDDIANDAKERGLVASFLGVRGLDEFADRDAALLRRDDIEQRLATTAGSCAVMGTASTMASLAEALGMMPSGAAAIPAVDADRLRIATEIDVDNARLEQEIALFAERADICEELTRLESHCEQFASLVKSKEAVGRRLDFLLQEMAREANTMLPRRWRTVESGTHKPLES